MALLGGLGGWVFYFCRVWGFRAHGGMASNEVFLGG